MMKISQNFVKNNFVKRFYRVLLAALVCFSIITINVVAQDVPIDNLESIFHPVSAQNGMVSAQEALATKAGLEVLKEGGNAVDAAVTIGFTLAVTFPEAGNLGGGGFMLIHLADKKETIAIDYREKAPLAATEKMFLNEQGEVDNEKIRFSHLSSGVPGTVAGLITALEKYGTISLERALKPAINLAKNGFPVNEKLAGDLVREKTRLQAYYPSRKVFYKPDGSFYQVGEIFTQPDLANSLKLISKQGKKAFYQGEIAQKIVKDMKENEGLITEKDLLKYQPVIRSPIRGNYRGYDIYSMPPSSSGGVHLIEMLNILEKFPIASLGHNTAKTLHLMIETMKLAYADRYQFMGDTDFVQVPIERLISKDYADQLRNKINFKKATPSEKILSEIISQAQESEQTTHYSVVDKYGNAVANTYTLNFSYGSGLIIPDTGILLNNEMDDFTAKVDSSNAFLLRGGKFNNIQPEKRMLSSMTPTIILKDGQLFLVTGSPGGSRIITTVLQVIMNVIDHHMNIAEATNAVRIHHQWFPEQVETERGLNGDTINLLTQKGHKIVIRNAMGSSQSIMKIDKVLYGASDPRRFGALTLGY